MKTRDWMRGEYLPAKPHKARAKQTRSPIEIALATAGFAAWIWCAYELAITFIH